MGGILFVGRHGGRLGDLFECSSRRGGVALLLVDLDCRRSRSSRGLPPPRTPRLIVGAVTPNATVGNSRFPHPSRIQVSVEQKNPRQEGGDFFAGRPGFEPG